MQAPPCLWTVLVAPSAFYRKTTCIELGRRLLAAACPDAVTPMLYRYDSLYWHMRRADRLLAVDHFPSLMGAETRERLLESSDALAPLSILAGATVAQLSAQMPVLEVSSGFLARFLLIAPDQKTRVHGMPGLGDLEVETRLGKFLEGAARLKGTANFDRVHDEIENWGRRAADWISAHPGHTGLWDSAAAVASRMELTLLKLATLVEIAATNSLDVSTGSVTAAVALEHVARRSYTCVMNRDMGRAHRFHQELRLLGIVRRNPGITRRRLQRNSHLDATAFKATIENLERMGEIKVRANGANGHLIDPQDLHAFAVRAEP